MHSPSFGSVDLGGLTVERCPPAEAMGWWQIACESNENQFRHYEIYIFS